ncbi:MAG: ABC transporter substrate-binding protein [Halodesulfurarchaeum sp.]
MDRRSYLSGLGTAAMVGAAGCATLGQLSGGETTLEVVTVDQPPHFQATVMEREGLFTELPIAVDRKRASPTSASGLIVTERADIALLGIVPALVAIDEQSTARIVSASSKDAFVVLLAESAASFFEGSDATGFAGFRDEMGRNATLGTYPRGSSSDITARYWIENELETDRTAVDLVPLDGAGAARQALLAGEVDGAVIPEPTPTLIEERADTDYRRVAWVGDFFAGQPAGVTVVRGAYAAENPGVVEAFVAAHAKASRFIQEHPDRAATYLGEVVGGERALDPDLARSALASPAAAYLTNPHEIEDGAGVMADYAARLGKIDTSAEPEQLVDTSYYDRVVA